MTTDNRAHPSTLGDAPPDKVRADQFEARTKDQSADRKPGAPGKPDDKGKVVEASCRGQSGHAQHGTGD